MSATPVGLLAYRAATIAFAPAVPLLLRRRALLGKEQTSRSGERFGFAARARPEGPLVWIHGASVGECLAAIPVIEQLVAEGIGVLVTSGTVASATVMENRLPAQAIHQFVPVDTPRATGRFLSHWQPDVGLFVDSDLWPNLVLGARARGTHLALVNARISERSMRGWRWAPRTVKAILSAFELCLAQDEEFAERFRELGCRDVRVTGSLKADAPPLFADPKELEALKTRIGARPVIVAAQTHPGEDETILPAHDIVRQAYPDLLTIIVPRHIERGADIAMLCGTRAAKLRSRGETIAQSTAVYVADTLNELGLFYRLAAFAFVGGTLVPVGGHNPLEPACLNRVVLAGPHTYNATSAFDAILEAQGLGRVNSAGEIASLAQQLLADPGKTKELGEAAARGAGTLGGAVAETIAVANALLKPNANP
jgi:3-deoxy-D-manno-octulosonic-acid transferase